MVVRTKFKVDSVTKHESGSSIKLLVVGSRSKENEQFFDYTPWGTIEIGTVNEEAVKEFSPGDEFFVDFTKAK